MKKLAEVYFTFFLKPSLLVSCFISTLNFLFKGDFEQHYLYAISFALFLIKPIFFLVLYSLFLYKIEIKSFFQFIVAAGIILLIYFGFPVKELSDIIKYEDFNKFFDGKDYFIDEYMYNHYVCNAILENFPAILIVIMVNSSDGKWEGSRYFPILIHSLFLLVYGILLKYIFNRKR